MKRNTQLVKFMKFIKINRGLVLCHGTLKDAQYKILDGHRCESWLLHVHFNSLLTCQRNQLKKAQGLWPYTHVGVLNEGLGS